MRRFLRIFGIIVVFVAIFLVALRGIMGISFVMGDKEFYPPAGRFLSPETKVFKFVVLSDTGSQNRTLQRLVTEARDNVAPDFMLHLGDLVVYRNIEHMYWMMDELDDKLKGVPMYLVPGNHDIKKKKGVDKSMYQRVFGPTYYWFGHGDTLFIGLDSSTERIDDDQWAFFEQVMQHVRPGFRHVILFTHVPPVVPEKYHHHVLTTETIDQMAKMLKKYPVDAIFAGHVHYYSEQSFQGVPVYTVPPSGQYFVGPVRKFGYLTVQVDEKGVHVENTYSDRKKSAELIEIWFIDLVLTNKIRWIAGLVLMIGLVLWLLGQRRFPWPKKKH